jgi:hypothetical protein
MVLVPLVGVVVVLVPLVVVVVVVLVLMLLLSSWWVRMIMRLSVQLMWTALPLDAQEVNLCGFGCIFRALRMKMISGGGAQPCAGCKHLVLCG